MTRRLARWQARKPTVTLAGPGRDRYRSGESYGDCDVKQQATLPVADPQKNPNMFESGQLPIELMVG